MFVVLVMVWPITPSLYQRQERSYVVYASFEIGRVAISHRINIVDFSKGVLTPWVNKKSLFTSGVNPVLYFTCGREDTSLVCSASGHNIVSSHSLEGIRRPNSKSYLQTSLTRMFSSMLSYCHCASY